MQDIEIRSNDIQKHIFTQAGIYRWYMFEVLVSQLNVPINIMGNTHPFGKELKCLRKESKNKFLTKEY